MHIQRYIIAVTHHILLKSWISSKDLSDARKQYISLGNLRDIAKEYQHNIIWGGMTQISHAI